MLGVMLAAVVVDQLDAPGALVEIAAGELVQIDARCLPGGAEEGDRVVALLLGAGARCPVRGVRTLPEGRGRGRRAGH